MLETQTFTGSGDFVQPVNVDTLAYVTFACPDCSSNTVLKSNGAETLMVNTIGAYSRSHFGAGRRSLRSPDEAPPGCTVRS